MPRYFWRCKDCEEVTAVVRRMQDIDTPPDRCGCGSENFRDRILHAPTVLRASHPDGLMQQKDDFKKIKESTDLEIAAANAKKPSDRKELQKASVEARKIDNKKIY